MAIDKAVLREIEALRVAAPHRSKTAVIRDAAQRLGVSTDTVYRELRTFRKGVAKEISRAPKYDRALVREIARRKVEGMRAGDVEREIPTDILRQELIDEGVPEEAVPSPSRINTILREEMGLRVGRTYRRIEATFANEQAQLDHSRSKYFQLKTFDEAAGDWLLVARAETLHYKRDNTKLRTWYTAYKDRYSRLWLARIVPASGESITVGLDHLDYVFTREPDEHPLRYVPHALQTDRGPLRASEPYKRAAEALGMEIPAAQSKEAQGSVENLFRHLWTRFELPLYRRLGAGATIHLSDLNAILFEFAVEEVRTRTHPVHRRLTREEAYLASLRAYPPREIDTSVLRIACRIITRRVDAYGKISVDGVEWAVPQYVGDRLPTQGQQVRVWMSQSGEAVAELVDKHAPSFTLTPWRPNQLGDYSRPAEPTFREQLETELDRERKEARERAAAERATAATEREARRKIRTLPPEPQPLKISSPILDTEPAAPASATLTHDEARRYIGRFLDRSGLPDLAHYADVFGPLLSQRAGIAQSDVDELCSFVLAHRKAS